MIIRSKEEFQKCKELQINITMDETICRTLGKTIGLPDPELITKKGHATIATAEGLNRETNKYLLVAIAVVEGKVYYQALGCRNTKTTGLVAYCYIQEKKERIRAEAQKCDSGKEELFKNIAELKKYVAEGKF